MPDRTGIFLGWSANLSNFLGLRVEAGASPMYPQKMRVPPLGGYGSPWKHGRVLKQTTETCKLSLVNYFYYFNCFELQGRYINCSYPV